MNEAIDSLREAIEAMRKLNPEPSSLPGPLEPQSGRVFQAVRLSQAALDWLTAA